MQNFTNLLELYQRAMGEGRQSKTEARELKHKARQAEKNRVPVLNPRDPNFGAHTRQRNGEREVEREMRAWILRLQGQQCSSCFCFVLRRSGIPIIVVPAAMSAVINMYNVKQLLENGVLVTTAIGEAARGWLRPLTAMRSGFVPSSAHA